MRVTYQELLKAGYKPDQIVFCPSGDPCPCDLNGPQKDCKFVERHDHLKPMVFDNPDSVA